MANDNKTDAGKLNLMRKTSSKENKNEDKKNNLVAELFNDYLSSSTIHGVSHLGIKDQNFLEKIWWLIGLMLSVSTCTFLISRTWIKWKENPVIVSFAQEHTAVWQIPFPAVTVCPNNKVRNYVYNYTYYFYYFAKGKGDWQNKHELEEFQKLNKKFWDISLICNLPNSIPYNEIKMTADNFTTDEELFYNIRNVAPNILNIVNNITWQNEYRNNGNDNPLFYEHMTPEGLCFTFNALGYSDMYTNEVKNGFQIINHNKKATGWSVESGYPDNIEREQSYPERTAQSGLLFGLNIHLFSAVYNRDYFCGDAVPGFKIILHNPGEIPRLVEQYFLAPARQQVLISVTPKLIKTSKNLINVSPDIRNCYFSHEKKLRFFKRYSEYNCKAECFGNVTKQYCGCVPFYLPKDNETRTCGYRMMPCLNAVKQNVFKYESLLKHNKLNVSEKEKEGYNIFRHCQCLVACDSLDYEVVVSQAEYLYDKTYESTRIDSLNASSIEITPIKIFFKDTQFLPLERKELYGQTDFIANIGGLLGLFLGFSFLSFLEIVYFLTLRVWCKLYRKTHIVPDGKETLKVIWVKQ